METINHIFLKTLRKAYSILFRKTESPVKDWTIQDPDTANKIIYDILATKQPCMIARFGATELSALVNYLGVTNQKHKIWDYIRGKQPQWWWNKNIISQMEQWSGFFPSNEENLTKFSKLLLEDTKYLDVLGSWLEGEKLINQLYFGIPQIMLPYLEPFHSSIPWSKWLLDKKVVVIHPFAESIKNQYEDRKKLFTNLEILPTFKSLRIIPAVQSIGGNNSGFKDWFEALEWMKSEMDKEDYDIALIGCGAYGFHLAAHAKRTGHQGIHLGGALQLLFGIKGRRWEGKEQCIYWKMPIDSYTKLFNDHWIKPSKSETPKTAYKVEGATYW